MSDEVGDLYRQYWYIWAKKFEGFHDCKTPASSGVYWNISEQIYPSFYILWNETQFPKIIKYEWKWILSWKYNVVNLLHNSFIYFFFNESSVFFVHEHPKQELLQESRRWNFRWRSVIVHNVPWCYGDKTLQSSDQLKHAP